MTDESDRDALRDRVVLHRVYWMLRISLLCQGLRALAIALFAIASLIGGK
jgi:hypothetical protein